MLLSAFFAVMFTGCKDDTEPRLQKPTEFVLNVPPMANQTVILEDRDDENAQGTSIYLTVSQPNYGIGVVTNYEVQVSYTEDFAEYQSLYTVDTQAKIQCSSFDMAVALCALQGLTEVEQKPLFDGSPRKTYIRVKAFVPHCDYSEIYSNVISMTIQPYFAVRVAGTIYLIGAPQGWDINSDAMVLSEPENGIGSKIYTGIFDIPADQNTFRFYTVLGDWETNSIGAQEEDKAVSVELEDGVYEGDAVDGKGAWTIKGWEGGKLKCTVNLSAKPYSVIFEKIEEE